MADHLRGGSTVGGFEILNKHDIPFLFREENGILKYSMDNKITWNNVAAIKCISSQYTTPSIPSNGTHTVNLTTLFNYPKRPMFIVMRSDISSAADRNIATGIFPPIPNSNSFFNATEIVSSDIFQGIKFEFTFAGESISAKFTNNTVVPATVTRYILAVFI